MQIVGVGDACSLFISILILTACGKESLPIRKTVVFTFLKEDEPFTLTCRDSSGKTVQVIMAEGLMINPADFEEGELLEITYVTDSNQLLSAVQIDRKNGKPVRLTTATESLRGNIRIIEREYGVARLQSGRIFDLKKTERNERNKLLKNAHAYSQGKDNENNP